MLVEIIIVSKKVGSVGEHSTNANRVDGICVEMRNFCEIFVRLCGLARVRLCNVNFKTAIYTAMLGIFQECIGR